jgi:hypothetical protein
VSTVIGSEWGEKEDENEEEKRREGERNNPQDGSESERDKTRAGWDVYLGPGRVVWCGVGFGSVHVVASL